MKLGIIKSTVATGFPAVSQFHTVYYSQTIIGLIPTGHLTTISVLSAKVAIKMVKISNYFFKNLLSTFTQMLNETRMNHP